MRKFLTVALTLAWGSVGLSSCATMTDQEGGLVEDHQSTVGKCGVGNYAFRHLKGRCGNDEIVTEKQLAPAPKPESVDPNAKPGPKPVAALVDNKIEIAEEVQFETGKSTLTASGKHVLDAVAEVIQTHHDQISALEIAGHTDHVGKPEKNQALSQKRADAVKAYLVSQGVDAKTLTAKGYGATMPKINPKGASKAEWSQNRRVEFNTTIQ